LQQAKSSLAAQPERVERAAPPKGPYGQEGTPAYRLGDVLVTPVIHRDGRVVIATEQRNPACADERTSPTAEVVTAGIPVGRCSWASPGDSR
jgi:hypothetical protein